MSPAQNHVGSEDGFVLMEVLVSALVLAIASAGVFTLMQSTVRTQGEQRHSSEGYALAQEDQARLSAIRLAVLNHLDETRVVTLNQTEFKVRSLGVFVNDTTSKPSCGAGTSSADYVQITSVVTWNGMQQSEKAKIESILSPSNGSLDPNNGTLAVSATNQAMEPMAGVSLSGTNGGAGAFSGTTDAAGCATFPDLTTAPTGNYTMTVSAVAAGLVNKDGNGTEQKTVGVAGGDTKNVALQFDHPGTIPLNFKYRVGSTEAFATAKADAVVAYNSGMTTAKALWTASGQREATVNATPLFPFSSAYTLYAGSCASNNPDPEGKNPGGAPAMANVVAPANGTATPVTIQLPALELVVKNGTPISGATITITDTACKDPQGNFAKRTYVSNQAGLPSDGPTGVAELGLPWGTYNLCASANISGNRRKKLSGVAVQNLAGATAKTIDLGSGYESGTC